MKINQQFNSFVSKVKDSSVIADVKDKVSHSLLKMRQNKTAPDSQAGRNATLPPQVKSPAVQVLEQPDVRQLIARVGNPKPLTPDRPVTRAVQGITAAVTQFIDNMLQKLGLKQGTPQTSPPPTKDEVIGTMKSVLGLPAETKAPEVLATFIGLIPGLPTDRKLDKDCQMEGLRLAQELIKNVKSPSEKATSKFGNAIALATADIVGQVNPRIHSHSLRTEMSALKKTYMNRGFNAPEASVEAILRLPGRWASSDKAKSKAMEMLCTALSHIKTGDMDPALSDKLIVLLHDGGPSKHMKQLKADFLAKASPEQRRDFMMHEVLPRGGA